MANTAEMLRLMRHAADRLAEERAVSWLHEEALQRSVSSDTRVAIMRRAASVAAALTLAESVLRMVAAAMDDEQTPNFFVPQSTPALAAAPDDVCAPHE